CEGCGSAWDSKQTAPVGQFAANAFGLHDMYGNAWEWTQDCWHGDYTGASRDGTAWVTGGGCNSRVVRGGSWFSLLTVFRAAARKENATDGRGYSLAFRVGSPFPP